AEIWKRTAGSNDYRIVQKVEYTYADDVTHSADVGADADLVQVKKSTLLSAPNPSDQWFVTYEQYRYHRTGTRTGSDERLTVIGDPGQLKCIIAPEQIE